MSEDTSLSAGRNDRLNTRHDTGETTLNEIISQIPTPASPTQWLIAAGLAIVVLITVVTIIKGVARMISGIIMAGAGLGLISVPTWPGVDGLSSLWPF